MKNEMAGGFAIVGCENNPNYNVWGARSDLGCAKKGPQPLTMSFKDWIQKEKKNVRQKNKSKRRNTRSSQGS